MGRAETIRRSADLRSPGHEAKQPVTAVTVCTGCVRARTGTISPKYQHEAVSVSACVELHTELQGFGRCALPRAAPPSGAESACRLMQNPTSAVDSL